MTLISKKKMKSQLKCKQKMTTLLMRKPYKTKKLIMTK